MRVFQTLFLSFIFISLFYSCEPPVTIFPKVEEAILYEASSLIYPSTTVDSLLIMTWNIRYGAARIPWFGDSCGERVILTENEVMRGLEGLAREINEVNPDIVLLQEVDVESKRTSYIDQVQWLLDHTSLNYGAYASEWQAQFIPSDGIGRLDVGNAILSRWQILDPERIQLSLRTDQDALTKYFYLRWNMLKANIDLPEHKNFYVVNIHATSSSEDGITKKTHIDDFKEILDTLDEEGALFVGGGDLNELPPGSDSTNFCDVERCPDDPEDFCPDGADYIGETDWVEGLYNTYNSAVPLNRFLENNDPYFTYSRAETERWYRKLDYLFTNGQWVVDSDSTHLDAITLSDHAPVSAKLLVTP